MAVFDRRIKHKNGTVSVMRYIRCYLPDGKVVSKSLGPAHSISKTRAKVELEIFRREQKKQAKLRRSVEDDPFLELYANRYLYYVRHVQKKRSWKRDVSSTRNLGKYFYDKRLSEITPKDLNRYREARLSQGRSPRTVNLEMSCLSRLYKVAEQDGLFAGNCPVKSIAPFEIQYGADRILSPEEQQRLIQHSPQHLQRIIICALNTGMRRGDIVGLKWSNVNLDQGHILLEAISTKSKRQTTVPISSIMDKLFREIKEESKKDHVFLNSHGEPYHDGVGIRRSFYTARRKAGIEDFRFHDLRHTAATRLVEAGVPLFVVSKILGHSDPKMTMRYAHPDKSLKEGIEALALYNSTIDTVLTEQPNKTEEPNLP